MTSRMIFNLLAVCFGVILSLAFLEVTLRIYNPITRTVALNGDTAVLRRNIDEIQDNGRTRGVAPLSRVHQNSLGFRGAEPPVDFSERLTIVTVGGSTTRDVTEDDDHTWTALLGDAVAHCFGPSWINNAGIEAHSSLAHIDLIRKYINQLHPKVVLLLIGANELRADGLISSPNDLSSETGIKSFFKRLAGRIAVVDLALTAYRSYRMGTAIVDRGDPREGDAMPLHGEERLAAAREVQPAYAGRLRLIIQLLRQGNTVPVLVTQPTIGGTGPDPTTGTDLSRLWYGEFFNRSLTIYNDTMRQVAKGEEIDLIDLDRLLPKDTKYYWDPVHHTRAGVEKIAQLVAAGLLPVLERKFPPFDNGTCKITPANPA